MAFGRDKQDADPFGAARPSGPGALGAADDGVRSALRLDLLLIVLFVVLTAGGTAYGLHRAQQQDLDDPLEQAKRGEITGVQGLSLVKPANLRRALTLVQAKLHPDERLINFRLAPTRLDVEVRDTEGDERNLQVAVDYRARVISTSGESSEEGPRGVMSVPVAAPAKILAAVIARTHFDARRLDYFVYDPPQEDDPADWTVFFDDVPVERKLWRANGVGDYVRLPSEPDPEDEARRAAEYAREDVNPDPGTTQYAHLTVTRDGESHSYSGQQAIDVARCIRQAKRDTEAILRCIR